MDIKISLADTTYLASDACAPLHLAVVAIHYKSTVCEAEFDFVVVAFQLIDEIR